MFTNFDLSTHSARQSFDSAIAALLRAQEYDQAEAVLSQILKANPSPVASLCLGLPRDEVRVDGWGHFNERLNELAETLPVTAVWLDLSNYCDDHDDGLRHPVIEIGYENDADFAFSREDRESLLALSATYPAPWTGSAKMHGSELIVKGLAPLNDWLVNWENEDDTLLPSVHGAQWFELLRYHQAIASNLGSEGLVVDVPVIVGAHDVGPWCKAVLYREKPFTKVFPAENDPRKRAKLEAEIQYQIDTWENVRASCTLHYEFGRPDYLAKARGFRDMADRWFEGTPFEGAYPLEMDETNFNLFLQRWRQFRDPTWSPPPAPSLLKSVLRRGFFGRRGL